MKLRHNKLRNTSLIFELLTRQITSDSLAGKESDAIGIIKKFFVNTELIKEYKIYVALTTPKKLTEEKAGVYVHTAIEAHKSLNKKKLRNEKYELIAEIKKHYNLEEFFKAKVDNYKLIASVSCLLENYEDSSTNVSDLTKMKFTVMENLVKDKSKALVEASISEYVQMDEGTRSLTYKILVEKFNHKYKALDNDQKEVLREYINNVSITPQLKKFINERLIEVMNQLKDHYRAIDDKITKVKIKEIINISRQIMEAKNACEDDVTFLLNGYELLKEIRKVNEKVD